LFFGPEILTFAILLHEAAPTVLYTDIKENQIFLIDEEIQKGAVAKSYMTNGLLLAFPHILGSPSSYMTLQLLHSKFPYI
jgi:hypothetical protein